MVMNYILFQGIKRSITSLEGGTLGYAEIIAIKVRERERELEHIQVGAASLL